MSKTFLLRVRQSRDFGAPTRFVYKVFDEPATQSSPSDAIDERTEELLEIARSTRKQVRLQISRTAGKVREIQIQKVPTGPDATTLETILTLDRTASARFLDLVRALPEIPLDGDEPGVRVDDSVVRDVFSDPNAMNALYRRDPERFRQLIANDATADDLIAVKHRKRVVDTFRDLVSTPSAFEQAQRAAGGSPERVWQQFLEDNPWILGVTLAGPLLTSWDESRLEQVVAGASVASHGKRTDALLQTNGAIRSLVFAEIKHHQTPLLGREYRGGAWAPSVELTGGISQLQQTVHLARRQIGERLSGHDEGGADTGDATYLVRPRSYLIIGHLGQLRGQSGVHQAKHRSFELYRRNLYEPEIVTFDELLARAEWHVSLSEIRP